MQKVLTGTSLRRIIAAAVSAVITVMCPISYVGPGGIAIRTEDVSAESGSADADVLLDIDYDTNNPDLTELDRGEMPTYSVLEDNGNKYLNISPKYSNFGYMLGEGIPTDGEWYKVSFDFAMSEANNANILALTDTNTDALGGDNVYDCFGLLRLDNGDATGGKNLFRICDKTLGEEIFKSNVWFGYELKFNRQTREIKLTIREKDNPENKAALNTVLSTGSGWSDGIPSGKIFNAIKFTRSGNISIDNIKVEKNVSGIDEPNEKVFLDIDYDTNNPELIEFNSGEMPTYRTVEDNGNKYFNISPNYSNFGYKFSEGIPTDGEWYRVAFDFMMSQPNNAYIVALSDSNTDALGGNNVYNCFGLLRVNNNSDTGGATLINIGGKTMNGEVFKPNVWLSYSLIFNRRTREISATVSERDDPKNKAILNTVLGVGSGWSDGIPDGAVFDAFKFSRNGNISIDNIKVAQLCHSSFDIAVTTAKYGNIFGGGDEKTFDITVSNPHDSKKSAEISYKVIDEYDRVIDEGGLGTVTVGERNRTVRNVKANVDRFGIYYFVVYVKSESEGSYTDKTAFSVVNKRADGELLNSAVGANVLRPTSAEEWNRLKTIMLDAGISGMRTDLRWGEVETTDGVYTDPDYTEYYQDAVNSGIENMVILNASNKSGTRPDQSSTDIYPKWEKYIDYVSKTYKDSVTYWEIINEPNERMLPEKYVDYLKRAYPIIKQNDADSKIAGLATASLPWWWIKETLYRIKANPKAYLDLITFHPYDFDSGDMRASTDGLEWCIKIRDSEYQSDMEQLNGYKSIYNCQNIPYQFTEMGITSTPGVCTPRAQATELVQMYTMSAAQGTASKVWWYCLENTQARGNDEVIEGDTEGNFGLVGNKADKVPMAAKPSYAALAGFNKMLTNAEFIDSKTTDSGTRVYRFKRSDGNQIAVVWSEGGEEDITLNLGAQTAEVYDIYTNKITALNADGGGFNLTASSEPIYLSGNFSALSIDTAKVTLSNKYIKIAQGGETKTALMHADGRELDIVTESGANISATCGNTEAILDIDYDTKDAKLTEFDKGEVPFYNTLEDNGNKYLSISPRWSNFGYKFSEEIPTDGEWYKVSFDFFMEDANNANIVALTDTDTDALGGDNVYNCFGLLRLNNNEATGGKNLFGICGETLNDEIFKPNVWFKYNLIFNRRTREIKLTISERDNPQNKAVLNTVLGTGSGWSDGIPSDKVFNALKFTRSGKIGIDNIRVEKYSDIDIIAAYSCDSQEPINIIAYDGGSPIYFGRINVLTEEYVLDRLEKDGTKIIAYSQLADGTYQLKINVENIAPRTESPTLCIAYYDKANRLINLEMQDINITQRGANKVDVTLSGTAAASRINIMLIGCRNNMAPLSKNINFITFVK